MFCSNCGNKLADGSKFCSGCGTKVGEIKVEETGKAKTQANKIPIAAQTYFEQGKKYQEKGDNKNACSSYKAAIDIAPDFWEAHKKFAVCLKDIDKAYNIINRVISKNPDDYESYLIRGRLYYLAGNTEKALLDYEITLKLKPDDLETYKAIILTYEKMGAWDNVIEIASKAIKIAPQEYSLYYSRGGAFFQKNLLDNAISDFSKSLEIIPDSTKSLSDIACAYFKIEDYDNALKYINRFFEKIPDNAACTFIRGKIYYYKGDFEKAIKDFDVVEKLSSEIKNHEFYKLRAIARYKAGYYENHADKIREDYLKLYELVSSDESQEEDDDDESEYKSYKELNFFKDIMVERYKKALLEYEKNKETYLIKIKKSYGDNDCLGVAAAHIDFRHDDYPIIFFNKSFADDFRKLASEKNDYITCKNIKNMEPAYWFIIHSKTGELYRKGGKRTWSLKTSPQDNEYKYENIEDAIEDYEEIIHMELFDRDPEFYTIDGMYMGIKYFFDEYFMDLFIAGSY